MALPQDPLQLLGSQQQQGVVFMEPRPAGSHQLRHKQETMEIGVMLVLNAGVGMPRQ